LVQLVVRRVAGPGRELWWSVELVRPDGSSPLTGQLAVVLVPTRDQARRLWKERERALQAAGYRRTRAVPMSG
jgi:hypothetical protein